MANKELKRLNRRELVEIIYQMKKNEERLQSKISQLEGELEEKQVRDSEAESIAEAAKDITFLFSSAQETTDLYLKEVASMKDETAKECEEMIAEAKLNVEMALADGKRQFDKLNEAYKSDYVRWKQLKAEIQELEAQKQRLNGEK